VERHEAQAAALRLLQESRFLALATARDDVPHCSLMAYAASADGRAVYMLTGRGSRKYRNVQQNTRVSLLVDRREAAQARGLDAGEALTAGAELAPLSDPAEAEAMRAALLERHPDLADFVAQPGVELLKFELRWLLYLAGVSDEHYWTVE
jgi:nitroimidazol reductase NimA-like FMN-containing flavoprotein (pyridoxamine 5'-phosphate oxidase superfamily)